MDYTVTLTDTQVKCMEYITTDALDWIENAAVARAYVAQKEIIRINTDYCNANGIAIAVGVDAQVAQAYSTGAVQTAAAREAAWEASVGLGTT